MARTIVACVAAFAVGIGAGAVGMQTLGPSQPVADTGSARSETGLGDARLDALQERLDQARAENASLRDQLATMETELPEPSATDEPEADVDLSRVLGALAPSDKNVGEHLAEEAMEAAREQQREEWRARREEWSNNFRGGMQQFLDTAYAEASTPAEQERIAALGEYGEAMFELRRQMGDAETDEEREALGEAMRENWDGMRDLMREQQDHMFRETLEAAGIKKRGEQRLLIENIRETIESPFFMGSRGSGGFGGPPGGFGRRGDGDR